MQRYDLINKIIKENFFQNYLEIGVFQPTSCFDRVQCFNKDSVDPGIENPVNPVKYPFTSDEFFRRLDTGLLDKPVDFKWDVIFIDGLHISTQVKKDVINSLNHLSDGGYIILHDCNPPTLFFARENYLVDGQYLAWNGTTWKVLYELRATRSDLEAFTVNTDWGLGIVRPSKKPRSLVPFTNPYFEYNQMSENRIMDLGLIETHELDEWLEKINE